MKITRLATILLGLGMSGCQMVAGNYPYEVIVVNHSNTAIDENRVFDSSGEFNYGCGYIGPSGYKSNAGPMETAPNDLFVVRWRDAQGLAHEQKLDLRKRVKSSFKGELVFVYRVDGKFTVEIVNAPDRYPIPKQRNPN